MKKNAFTLITCLFSIYCFSFAVYAEGKANGTPEYGWQKEMDKVKTRLSEMRKENRDFGGQ